MFEVVGYFLKLGCFGFGGPLALVASMQKDLVEERRWISTTEFQQAFSLIKAMPGPVAFQLAVYLGRARAGIGGGLLAGLMMVLPAFLMMIGLATISNQVLERPDLQTFLLGLQIAALAVVASSLRGLVQPYLRKFEFWGLLIFAGVLTFWYPAYEPLVIVLFGVAMALRPRFSLPVFFTGLIVPTAEATTFTWDRWGELISTCFKAGALVFGSGLAIIPLLEHDFVSRLGWLSHNEFMTALAFGQVTPGPVMITVTYIGYKVAGWPGALAATFSVFAASFFHMLTWFPRFVSVLSRQTWIPNFLMGSMAAVVGSIAATVVRLMGGMSLTPIMLVIGFLVLLASWRAWLPAWALIPLGGIFVYGLSLGLESIH